MFSPLLPSRLLIACLTGLLLLPALPAYAGSRLYTNTNALFNACIQRCEEPTGLGSLTRRGCYKGCAEIRRSFRVRASYRSMAACIEDMNNLEIERDLVIERHQAWCDNKWTHLHKRKGCKDAMEVYIRAATVNTICYHQTPTPIALQSSRAGRDAHTMSTPPSASPVFPAPASSSVVIIPEIPVFDTPKYSPAPVQSANTRAKAPVLKPPKQAAPPAPALRSQQKPVSAPKKIQPKADGSVPVITPSTAIAPKAGQSGPTAKNEPYPPTTTASAQSSAPAPAPQPDPAPQADPALKDASLPAANKALPAPKSEITPASAPTAPPVISPPTPILPAFSASTPVPAQPLPPAPTPSRPQVPATGQTASLLPSLSTPPAQSQDSPAVPQAGH